jgi:hypothetical protein
MKGGFLVFIGDDLFNQVAPALVELGGTQTVDEDGDGVVQFTDGHGHLFTLYERVPVGTESEVHEGPFTAAAGVQLPNMQSVGACPFECRSPDLLVRVALTIAKAAHTPTWILDGDGVIWDAADIDPAKVQL